VMLTCAACGCVLLPVFAAPFAPEECVPSPLPASQQLHRQELCDWPVKHQISKIEMTKDECGTKTHINDSLDLSHPNSNIFPRFLKTSVIVGKFLRFFCTRFQAARFLGSSLQRKWIMLRSEIEIEVKCQPYQKESRRMTTTDSRPLLSSVRYSMKANAAAATCVVKEHQQPA
jgi:hypothetical protein